MFCLLSLMRMHDRSLTMASSKRKMIISGREYLFHIKEHSLTEEFKGKFFADEDIRKAHGYILVFDIMSRQSFEQVVQVACHSLLLLLLAHTHTELSNNLSFKTRELILQVRKLADGEKKMEAIPFILVGNLIREKKPFPVTTSEIAAVSDYNIKVASCLPFFSSFLSSLSPRSLMRMCDSTSRCGRTRDRMC